MKYKILYRCRACSKFFTRKTPVIDDESLRGWLNEVATHYCEGLTNYKIGVGIVIAFQQIEEIKN